MREQDSNFVRTLIERFCAPKPTQRASVWAENELVLNEPKIKGPFSFSGREYLRELVDCAGPLPENLKGGTDFMACLGTGSGKTIGMVARLCYRIANDPMRALVVKPTGKGAAGATNFAKTRLIKSIKATPSIRDLIPSGGQSRFDITANSIMLNGSIIDLTGSNSVAQLGENRCDVVEQDEIDKYPPQTETSKEANPITLADERTKSVPEARRFKQSTPTLDNTGIWEHFKKSDQRRYFVPCPHCNQKAYEKIRSKNNPDASENQRDGGLSLQRNDKLEAGIGRKKRGTRADKTACDSGISKDAEKTVCTVDASDEKIRGWVVLVWSKRFTVFTIKGYEAYIRWDEEAKNADGTWDLDRVVKSAHMVCPHCEGNILNSHKHEMNRAGEWRATAKGVPGHIGWHLPSMYSIARDCDFGQMAKKFLTAKRSLDGVKGFINSDLAEPDVNQSVSVDRIGAAGKHIEITGEWLKIMSVDYQQHAPYFWAMVRAWNGSNESHGIEYASFNQWDELDEFQAKHKIIPQAVIIDVGFSQSEVLNQCASLGKPSRCSLDEPIQDKKPLVNGWNPCKSFGEKRMWRDEDTGLYRPYRINSNLDPYSGTDMAHQMRIELLEFRADLFEDMMDNVRNGKTHFKWTISTEVDTEEYHKHLAGKVRKPKKNNPRDYTWASRRTDWQDHLHACELMNFVLAYRLKLISFDAIQSLEKQNKKTP